MSAATKGSETVEDGVVERGTFPALGRGVWLVLLRNEWFKARHRLAFVVTLSLYALINVMEHGGQAYQARTNEDRSYGFPEAWSAIFADDSVIFLIFASIAVIMLASSEFTWRTARQNVIDGLAKTQWYWGKVIMLGVVIAAFLTVTLGIGVTAALMGTDFAAAESSVFPLSALVATLGLTLAVLNAGGLALLCSVTIRNSGPAMAVWFFWVTLGEQLLPSIVLRFWESAGPALEMLPFATAQQVLPFWKYDATAYANIVARAEVAETAAPELPNMLFWLSLNAGWAVLFIGLGYVLFRRRDL
jgi:ABC-type transport system involved in multi-copper enzyme maturation permease subunit